MSHTNYYLRWQTPAILGALAALIVLCDFIFNVRYDTLDKIFTGFAVAEGVVVYALLRERRRWEARKAELMSRVRGASSGVPKQ